MSLILFEWMVDNSLILLWCINWGSTILKYRIDLAIDNTIDSYVESTGYKIDLPKTIIEPKTITIYHIHAYICCFHIYPCDI